MPKQTSMSKNDMSNFEKINFYARSMPNSAWEGSTVEQVVDDDNKLNEIFDEIDQQVEVGQFTQDEPAQEDQEVEQEQI